ncbi:DUF2752 domain-containing protein [Nocardioides sp. C4-1]|uniref:DUF2752 domain-containing protein n=1 Tax=Nocardioides sp. C4-1 TaxID=3151851 RepID=UPI003266ADC3
MRRAAPSAEPLTGTPAAASIATAGAGAAVLALGAAVVLSPDGIEDGPVVCPFRRLTGLPCPGCGLTRSWVYLAHGRWDDAYSAHPFGIVAMAAAVALVAAVVLGLVTRRPMPDVDRVLRRTWALAVVAAWLVFGVVRLGSAL